MGLWRGCEILEDLWYDLTMDVWIRREPSGPVTLGMTDVAQARCGKIVHVQFRKVGRVLERGKSAATIESAKWVGAFPSPLSGTLIAVNDDAFARDRLIANRDPYGEGWMVRLAPTAWETEQRFLVTGTDAFERYRERIDELNVTCIRCAD